MEPFSDGWTKDQVEAVIVQNDADDLLYVPIVATMDSPDYEWSESICIRLADHENFNVRGNAILGFGHLARVFGRASNQARAFVSKALTDEHEFVSNHAISARDDIEHFTGTQLTEQGEDPKPDNAPS